MFKYRVLDDKLYIYDIEDPDKMFDYEDFDLEGKNIILGGMSESHRESFLRIARNRP